MNPAPAASCATGAPVQKFLCAWNRPVDTTGAAHAGAAGHPYLPLLIVLVIVAVLIIAFRKRRSGTATASR